MWYERTLPARTRVFSNTGLIISRILLRGSRRYHDGSKCGNRPKPTLHGCYKCGCCAKDRDATIYAMHLVALLLSALIIATVLWDAFETVVLPRSVTRRLRLTLLYVRATWSPWRKVATLFQ